VTGIMPMYGGVEVKVDVFTEQTGVAVTI
jgi:hypothetical protein